MGAALMSAAGNTLRTWRENQEKDKVIKSKRPDRYI